MKSNAKYVMDVFMRVKNVLSRWQRMPCNHRKIKNRKGIYK